MKFDDRVKDIEDELKGMPEAISAFKSMLFNEKFNVACDMSNSVTVNRMGYNDHGKTHSLIVGKNSLKIMKLLLGRGIQPTFLKEKHGSLTDAYIIVLLSAMMHDLGNSVHRELHYLHGSFLANLVAEEIIPKEKRNREYMKLAIMECVFTHDESVNSTSIESGIVKVADGTDCANGRARIPYRLFGKTDIHAVSALAIKNVEIKAGKEKPVEIIINMENPAGVFQIEEVLTKKVNTSTITDHVKITTLVNGKPLR